MPQNGRIYSFLVKFLIAIAVLLDNIVTQFLDILVKIKSFRKCCMIICECD